MADGDLVTLERDEQGVALVRLNRPKANALSSDVLHELRRVVEYLAMDLPGAVVVWGGERIFAAGADIAEFGTPTGTPELVAANFHAALNELAALPRVSIAAVNGYALGGGMELAMACDFRLCASDAKFGQPEINLGIIPGGGGTQRLPRLIGVARAKELILSGRQIGADEALAYGLVNRVVPPGDVLSEALAWATGFARGPLAAQALAKSAIDRGMEATLVEGLGIERSAFVAVARTEDAGIGIASFREQGPGKATFVGR
jgi:enoyl-CoA hydratase